MILVQLIMRVSLQIDLPILGKLISPVFSLLKAKVMILTPCHLKGRRFITCHRKGSAGAGKREVTVIHVLSSGCAGFPGHSLCASAAQSSGVGTVCPQKCCWRRDSEVISSSPVACHSLFCMCPVLDIQQSCQLYFSTDRLEHVK